MLSLHPFRGDRLKIALLSGDAECGKSYAIAMLDSKLKALGISSVVSAMTNKAAGTLMEGGSLLNVLTFHKMMGLKKDLLDDKLNLEDFASLYREVHWKAIRAYSHFADVTLDGDEGGKGHSCKCRRPESCSVCSKALARIVKGRSGGEFEALKEAPPFLGANVLVEGRVRFADGGSPGENALRHGHVLRIEPGTLSDFSGQRVAAATGRPRYAVPVGDRALGEPAGVLHTSVHQLAPVR